MPRKVSRENPIFAQDPATDPPVVAFIVKRKLVDEILSESGNKRVFSRHRTWLAIASGSKIDHKSKQHHRISEKLERSHDAEGKKVLEVRTLVLHTLDNKHKIIGTLHFSPFSILSKAGKKSANIGCTNADTPLDAFASIPVDISEGIYATLSSGAVAGGPNVWKFNAQYTTYNYFADDDFVLSKLVGRGNINV